MFPTATRDAADLLQRLLVFDPEKRLTASEALAHPYVARFHDASNEPRCTRAITIPINDNEKVCSGWVHARSCRRCRCRALAARGCTWLPDWLLRERLGA